jgi:hypothetical protein
MLALNLFCYRRAKQKHLTAHLFRLLVLALVPQYPRQVVHARQCVWMLLAQYRLPQPQYLTLNLFCLLVLALIPQH